MRLFVALIPPGEAVAELAAALATLPSPPGLRWTPRAQWHLTLAFLAEVDEPTRDQLITRLGRVATRHPAPQVSLSGAGRFGDRVLFAGIDGDRAGLARLAESVGAAAARCGLPIEHRRWRPHLTLARAGRPGPDLGPLVKGLQGFTGRPWPAERLHLVRSRLGAGPDGTAEHEPMAAWPFTGHHPPTGPPAPGPGPSA